MDLKCEECLLFPMCRARVRSIPDMYSLINQCTYLKKRLYITDSCEVHFYYDDGFGGIKTQKEMRKLEALYDIILPIKTL